MALADHPRVMLPIILYNLVQHLVAGMVDRLKFAPRDHLPDLRYLTTRKSSPRAGTP